jgi:putative DNA primase/helicase
VREEGGGVNPRPTPLPVKIDGVPLALRNERRWVVWSYAWEEARKKWVKRPRGKTNDPATWTSFEDALGTYRAGRADGIGFCLGDGWAGADLDHCRDATGAVDPRADLVIEKLAPAYVEVSPSGTGFKAFGRAERIGFQLDFRETPMKATAWVSGRFFAVTGHGFGDPTAEITRAIEFWTPAKSPMADSSRPPWVLAGDEGRKHIRSGFDGAASLSDDQLLRLIAGSAQGNKFLRLWQGGQGPAGPLEYASHSEADLALCSLLAFWTGYDEARVERLFRRSDLMRDKWDVPSYRRATLARALMRRVA